jgi:protein disulfide-isomerase
MKKVVFSSPAFSAYAKKNLVLLDVDFPQKKKLPEKLAKQNAHLEKLYHTDGYPTLVLLDPKGKVLGQQSGYNGEKAADIIAWVEKLKKK